MSDEDFAPARRLDTRDPADTPILSAKNLAVKFKVERGEVDAVRGVSFDIHRGETVAVVGESGSGKSVTARAIMGLLSKRATTSPDSQIFYRGKDQLKCSPRERRALRGDRISMIFPEPMSALNPV